VEASLDLLKSTHFAPNAGQIKIVKFAPKSLVFDLHLGEFVINHS